MLTSSATTGNQWYLNDSLILNATNQTLIVTENGIYTLIVTVGGCSSLKSAAVTIINAGINNASKNSYFSIYPNPVVTILYIDYSDQKQRAYLIFDNFGSIVKKGFLDKKSEEISVFELSSGFYYFHLEGTKPRKFSKIN